MYNNDNSGLIATQNRDRRMAFENALKSYAAVVQGVNGNKSLLKELLGERDYSMIMTLGFTKFCYEKTRELYERFPFPGTGGNYKGDYGPGQAAGGRTGAMKFGQDANNRKSGRNEETKKPDSRSIEITVD